MRRTARKSLPFSDTNRDSRLIPKQLAIVLGICSYALRVKSKGYFAPHANGSYAGLTQTMALRRGSPARNTATVLTKRLHKDGREFDISLTISPVKNQAGRDRGRVQVQILQAGDLAEGELAQGLEAARVEDRVQALCAGFQILLPKPVEAMELVATVAALAKQAE